MLTLVTYYSVLAWIKLRRKYRVPQIQKVRAEFQKLRKEADAPLVICANHLTVIDSLLIMWALAPGWRCFLNGTLMPWNLPDKKNFSGNVYIRFLCYIGRCIPIIRQGPREETKRVMGKINLLLHKGHSILLFPEGGRSRVGRVDTENFSYGVGNILQDYPKAKVLCVFLRGKYQKEFSDFPQVRDEFYIDLRLCQPVSESVGMRGARDLATQVVQNLAQMERKYFALQSPTSWQ